MGAVNSCCIPRRSFEECRENKISTPRVKGHRRNLSATFNFSFGDDDSGDTNTTLLNINVATEEELMTLPGINRSTAQNIIDYRRQISNFKKIEDLALVSGVGATKLSHIRSEICVSSKRTPSLHSNSPDGSKSDLNSSTTSSYRERKKTNGMSPVKVNVNSANVFQLMKVKGLGQSLAENIVIYRDKKGPFKSIDDLVKVKGIGPSILSAIQHSLTLDDSDAAKKPSSVYINGGLPNNSNTDSHCECNDIGRNSSRASMDNLVDILGPLSKKPFRAEVVPFNFKWKNRRVFRIASWNLEQFSEEKSRNPGVQEVVALTLLENGFGIVALQELASEKALERICDELNTPTSANNKKWAGHRGNWRCSVSEATGRMYRSMEYNAFLYDTSQNIELVSCSLLKKPESGTFPFVRRPFLGVFKINKKFDCVVVSVHLKAAGLQDEALDKTKQEVRQVPALISAIEQQVPGENDIIIVGDFNLSPDSEDYKLLTSNGYTPCIPATTPTNISNRNPDGSRCYDNIWINRHTKEVYTGRSSVVRDGLSNPWIPNGWSWGGVVSDHCPVFTEICSNKDLDNGNINAGMDSVVFTVGGGDS
ncbi:endonuclease/exonuclease/phosphatase family domain-containing protein 1-like [Haliotis rufescens]|uniref:endonuclease/exonuclease/phosphatase family domain-containing protein 1-like n=1 Tax=Haliotis rufescens TaxID=6454 RepID=UPI00201F142B|nr:endonuclease/exonuclease/phosphatase family domain-containing protein 1-like [Haliotis rufescens]XP_046360472.2 endonuclease/exonuclease/phosphatase family domain-containing protein 1-like [Haliotis rufescens]XP_046360473.2 endonuclease/exonuclease/phosphatase family domain-containing protein 1-like [Haliotis rufescens]XP_046360474.2 endonuclease/exonuclease/phosphatase family domain-containing protein 1-like [Haliotis rufescens]XP_046360475.2 endonuclease/exonuclease/phosphatase family doma